MKFLTQWRLLFLLLPVYSSQATAAMACGDGPSLNEKVNWDCQSRVTARLSLGQDFDVMIGKSKEAVDIAVRPVFQQGAWRYIKIGVGAGEHDLCNNGNIKLNFRSLKSEADEDCGSDALECRVINGYSSIQKIIIARTGLEIMRVDDGECDAVWIYFSNSHNRFEVVRVN